MPWLELSVPCDREGAEAVYELLGRHSGGRAASEEIKPDGGGGMEPAPSLFTVRAYLEVDGREKATVECIEKDLWHLSRIRPLGMLSVREVAEEDWLHAWRQYYHIQHIGRRMVIVPSWEEYQGAPREAAIRLDPGLAFGTGLHQSTRTCLVALEKYLVPGMRVLDVGTGSGILALAAARLGAGAILAVDTDAIAVRVAGENIARNGLEGIIQVRQGSLEEATGKGPFDLILANILAEVVAGLIPRMVPLLVPQGIVIGAGIIASREHLVEQALTGEGLAVVDRWQEDDWVALAGMRSRP